MSVAGCWYLEVPISRSGNLFCRITEHCRRVVVCAWRLRLPFGSILLYETPCLSLEIGRHWVVVCLQRARLLLHFWVYVRSEIGTMRQLYVEMRQAKVGGGECCQGSRCHFLVCIFVTTLLGVVVVGLLCCQVQVACFKMHHLLKMRSEFY